MSGKAARKIKETEDTIKANKPGKSRSTKTKPSAVEFSRRDPFEPEPGQVGLGPHQLREIGEIGLEDEEGSQGMVLELISLMGRLKARRASLKLSLSDVSQRSGLTRQAISKLENNRTINPTIGTLSRYAMALQAEIRLGIEQFDEDDNSNG